MKALTKILQTTAIRQILQRLLYDLGFAKSEEVKPKLTQNDFEQLTRKLEQVTYERDMYFKDVQRFHELYVESEKLRAAQSLIPRVDAIPIKTHEVVTSLTPHEARIV